MFLVAIVAIVGIVAISFYMMSGGGLTTGTIQSDEGVLVGSAASAYSDCADAIEEMGMLIHVASSTKNVNTFMAALSGLRQITSYIETICPQTV